MAKYDYARKLIAEQIEQSKQEGKPRGRHHRKYQARAKRMREEVQRYFKQYR